MARVRVDIVRWVDDAFPGWVEAHLTDADGVVHVIVDKVPIFTAGDDLRADSAYPVVVELPCRVVAPVGTSRLTVSLVEFGLESTTGRVTFEVANDLVSL